MNRLLVFNLAMDAGDPNLGFAAAWVDALAARVGSVDVVTMRAAEGASARANVRVHSLGKELGRGEPRRAAEFYRVLVRLLRNGGYDACFAHMTPVFALMASPLLRAAGVPCTLWYTHSAASRTLRMAARAVDRVVTASAQSFPVRSRKVVVTGHGVDTAAFSPADAPRPRDRFTVVCAGRIAPVKRLHVLVDAAAVLAAADAGAAVRIVGGVEPHDRAYAEDVRARIDALGLRASVVVEGPRPPREVPSVLRGADVFVNLSDTDSIDKAPLEAMACGLPVVTSNAAFRELLGAVDPRLVVAKGDPGAVAAACLSLRADGEDARASLGSRLREIVVRDHSLERLCDVLVGGALAARGR